jgi:hypothetical protein
VSWAGQLLEFASFCWIEQFLKRFQQLRDLFLVPTFIEILLLQIVLLDFPELKEVENSDSEPEYGEA